MMLASTVQFSRYGRSRTRFVLTRRRRRSWPKVGPRCFSHRGGRSLRTQQRARPARPPSLTFHAASSCTSEPGNDARTE
jgi:hypothetical protein